MKRKTQKNIKFDGVSGTYYCLEYDVGKIHLEVKGNDIEATFYRTWLKKKNIDGIRRKWNKKTFICVENFREKTMLEALEGTDLGRHFEDGMKDIYQWFKLPLGYSVNRLKNISKNKNVKD